MDTLTDPMLALGLSLIALALLGVLLLGLLRLRRRRSAAAAAVDLLDVARVEAESPTVRALRAQVRALEEALESAAEPEPAPVPVDTVAEADDVATYRRQVGLAVRAVALRTSADDDPRHVVARVAAAIQRLDDHDPAGRPVLPGTPGPVRVRSLSVAPPAPPAPLAPVAVESAVALEPEPEDEPAEAADVVRPEAEVVLPVPPPAPAAPRRGRRWLRHTAA